MLEVQVWDGGSTVINNCLPSLVCSFHPEGDTE